MSEALDAQELGGVFRWLAGKVRGKAAARTLAALEQAIVGARSNIEGARAILWQEGDHDGTPLIVLAESRMAELAELRAAPVSSEALERRRAQRLAEQLRDNIAQARAVDADAQTIRQHMVIDEIEALLADVARLDEARELLADARQDADGSSFIKDMAEAKCRRTEAALAVARERAEKAEQERDEAHANTNEGLQWLRDDIAVKVETIAALEAALAVARKREQRLREAGTALLVWADDPSYAPLDDGSYRDVVAAFRAALVDGPAAASGVDAPARCSGCGKVSERRPLGQTPDGWMRGRSKPGDDAQGRYWCPECVATLAEPEDEVTTSLGNADERGGRRVLSRGSSGSASAAADELNRIADRIIADHGETLRKLAEDD